MAPAYSNSNPNFEFKDLKGSKDSIPAMVLDDSCIMDRDFSFSLMGNVKNINVLTNLYITLEEEGLPLKAWIQNTFLKITSKWGDLVEMENNGDASFSCKRLCVRTRLDDFISEREEEDLGSGVKVQKSVFEDEKVSETSFEDENISMHGNKNTPTDEELHFEDPFNIYDILKNNKDKDAHLTEKELQYPLGFTPIVKVEKKERNNTYLLQKTIMILGGLRVSHHKARRYGVSVPTLHKKPRRTEELYAVSRRHQYAVFTI
ncbi:hypothetical protein Tco_0294045 [Tanacetum coccineum]